MKKSLIVGGSGFVGNYLIEELYNRGMDVYVTKKTNHTFQNVHATILNLDILDKSAIIELLFEIRPDYIYHLAAQSSVGIAWKNPTLTVDVNIIGSINVMDAARELFYSPRILLIGSGEEYGLIRPEESPIAEGNVLRPGNIYAATKSCQNMIGNIYAKAYDLDVMMVRAFNHIGPGQAPLFVVSDFCKQVAEIEKGIHVPIIKVGNLSSKRDFTDVRDVVQAYVQLMEKGLPGETYNVGSGKAIEIREILNMIIKLSSNQIVIEVDPNKIRPVDVPIIEANIDKIKKTTGWQPKIPIEQTIKETLNFWRHMI